MKTLKILALLLVLAAAAGFGTKIVRERRAMRAQVEETRAKAERARDELRAIYGERLDLLKTIAPETADQIRARTAALDLRTAEGLEQFDYFQNLVSESLSKWLGSPKAKNSPIVAKLRAIEIRLDRKRAEFHSAAFSANEGLVRLHDSGNTIAVFKAESLLHSQSAAAKASPAAH